MHPLKPPVAGISVVIVGGGVGGSHIARALSKALDPAWHRLTLVTARSSYVHFPACSRALVDPDHPLETVFMPYENLFGKFPGTLIHGVVTSIEQDIQPVYTACPPGRPRGGIVIYQSQDQEQLESIHYDLLVLATGTLWEDLTAFPSDIGQCVVHVEAWRAKFRDANHIVIIGGGAAGLETAGELKDIYPDKNVTIVHADRLPLNAVYPDRFRSLVERRIRARGVEFIFNDSIEGSPTVSESSPLQTRNGITINCDLLVPTRGGRPNTKYLSFLSPSPLSDRGFVKVDATLQLQHHPNIFAVGDMVDWPEIRQLTKIPHGHANVAVSNILNLLQGRRAHKKYKGTTELMMIANGKLGGSTYFGLLGGMIFGNCITRCIKSKDLLVNEARKGLALKP